MPLSLPLSLTYRGRVGLFDDLDVVGARRDLVALGGVLDADTLTAAYRAGVFPWPAAPSDEAALRRAARRRAVPVLPGTPAGCVLVPWCSPDPRAVLLPDRLVVPRSLRQLLRRCGWEATLDTAFVRVLEACAHRDQTWITGPMKTAYVELHERGGAHSVEVWDGDRLVGGLYGVLTGRVFSGESMFFHESGASKAAIVELCSRLVESGVAVLDTQQESEHLRALGQLLVHRREYVAAVRQLRDDPAPLRTDRRPLDRLG